AKLNKFLAKPRNVKFMYTSDHHWPYADERAISLNIQIARVFQPDLITDLSDFFDFADYSHWDNLKTPASQLWGSDLQRPLDLHADWHKKIEKVLRKKPIWLALWGNHDLWLYDFLMNQRGGAGIYTFASFLEELENNGTLINSWPDRKHVVKVSPRLKLLHGVNASKNPGTVAKNTLEDFAGKHYEPDAGQFYNVVYGHDHRSTVYDYYGVTAYGSGCNCLTNMPYLRAPANWQLGVVIGHFNTQSNVVDAQRINFYPTENGGLTCFVGEEQLFS